MNGKVNTGQPLKISARDWNKFVDKTNESPSGAGFTGFNPTPACMVRVISSVPDLVIPSGCIVTPIRSLFDRSDAEHRRAPIVEVAKGTVVNATQHPMIMFEPYSGHSRPALAVVSGCCWASVLVNDVSHRFATFGDVDGNYLSSNVSGPVALLVGEDFATEGVQKVFCNFGVGERRTAQLKTYTYQCYGTQLVQTEHTWSVSGIGLEIEEI